MYIIYDCIYLNRIEPLKYCKLYIADANFTVNFIRFNVYGKIGSSSYV